jgi:hypothetical protein
MMTSLLPAVTVAFALFVMAAVLAVAYHDVACSPFWPILLARAAALLLEAVCVACFVTHEMLMDRFFKHRIAASVVTRLVFIGALLVFARAASVCTKPLFVLGVITVTLDSLICVGFITASVVMDHRPEAGDAATSI